MNDQVARSAPLREDADKSLAPAKPNAPSDGVQAAFERFLTLQYTLSNYGATDTEPDWVMQRAVAVYLGLRRGAGRQPTTANEWELYTASMDCTWAAAQLTQALRELLGVVGPLFLASQQAKTAIRNALWRLDL